MISKLIAWGQDRAQAVARMQRALREYEVQGIRTTVPFFTWLLRQPAFAEGAFHTGFLDELLHTRPSRPILGAGPQSHHHQPPLPHPRPLLRRDRSLALLDKSSTHRKHFQR